MPEESVRVLLVGHCTPDAFALRTALDRFADGARFESANDDDALAAVQPSDVLLINRRLDGAFAARDGIELIRSLATGAGAPVMVLVSNFADAQAGAEAAGAAPGFGKAAMYAAESGRRLAYAVSLARSRRSG